LATPESGRLIPGTGSLRKVRFAPPSWHRGKRGSSRVCYAYFSVASAVYLVAVYGKDEKEDITPQDKRRYRALLGEIEADVKRRLPE
jgi:hypothetical protein